MVVRILRKKPDAAQAEVIDLAGSLESFQKEIGGYIQAVPLFDSLSLICNEDGKVMGLPYNFLLGANDEVVGVAIFVREEKENFCSLSDDDIKKLSNYFEFGVKDYVTRDLF